MEKLLPHINISGYPGIGKSTVTEALGIRYRTFVIPKMTTRPRRLKNEPEYIFVTKKEFRKRKKMGQFISITPNIVNKITYHNAILKPEYWPPIPSETEILISLFGSEAQLVKEYIPTMKLCFISFKNKELMVSRLKERCDQDNSGFEDKLAKIELHQSNQIEKNYEYIVYNDTSIEDCADQFAEIIEK